MRTVESKHTSIANHPSNQGGYLSRESQNNFFQSKQTSRSFFEANSSVDADQSSCIQAKLKIGEPNDKYEKEADSMADKVVQRLNQPDTLQTKLVNKETVGSVQSKCNSCTEDEKLQQKQVKPETQNRESLQKKTFGLTTDPVVKGRLKESKNGKDSKSKAGPAPNQITTEVRSQRSPEIVQKKENPELDHEKERQEESPLEVKRKSLPTGSDGPPADDENNNQKSKFGGRVHNHLVQTKPIFESKRDSELQKKCGACEDEEKINRKADDVFQPVSKFIYPQNYGRECDEGEKIYLKRNYVLQRKDGDDNAPSPNGSRESIVAAAKTMLGKIEAKNDAGGGRRVGAEHLLAIFHLAAPNVWDDNTIEYLSGKLPSWCGIFAVWCHKKAGKDIGTWQMGKGVSAFGTLTQTDDPQPGDIGYVHNPYQHHCIIEKVEGDTVFSIDGNSGNYSEVKQHTNPRSKYTAFFTAFGSGSVTGARRKEETAAQVHTNEGADKNSKPTLESRLSSTKGKGHPLPDKVKTGMEHAFASNFSNVRIHTDHSAVQLSRELNAQAFTHGSDIYFNAGKYNTGNSAGKQLLAHELTHTVQQGAALHKKSAPDIQKQDNKAEIDNLVSKVYDALDGWTDSKDSTTILNSIKGRNKTDTDKIISGVAGKANNSIEYVYGWMESDMVTSDWKNLLSHLISVQAYLSERAVANKINDLLSGYTSEDDSNEIYSLFSGSAPITGEFMSRVLTQYEAKSGYGKEEAASWLFGDMTSVASHKLTIHFFNSMSPYAVEYASFWIAKKVEDLIAGYTSIEDSQSIVTNFEKVPAELRSRVLFELNNRCKERWSQSAADALMEDMQMEDYEKLRTMMPELPIYNVQKNFLEWAWDKVTVAFDYVEALLEYVVCGLIGVILGVISIITDLISSIKDLILAPVDLLGFILYQVTGKWGKESSDKVSQFFSGLGQFFKAPGEAISQMWNDLVLEAKLIEGPFKECQQAIFWVKRVTNLVVNIILIIWAGYGAVKLALEAIEAVATLVKTGRLLSALRALPGKIAQAIKGLPASAARASANAIKKVIDLIQSPGKIIASTRNTITAIRLAAQDEGYFSFLRQQAGKKLANEKDFWKKRKDFWTTRSETINAGVEGTEGKLADAVDTAATNPGKSEGLIKEGEQQAAATENHSKDVMDEIKGDKPPTDDATAGNLEREKTLQQSALKEGNELTQAEMQAEAQWAKDNRNKIRPSTEPGYVQEIELPNGHIWRKTPEGVWCRFSLKPTLCALDFEGATELKPTRKVSRTEVAHDIGVQAGREFAENTLNLQDAGLVNPFEFRGKYGQGFDDIMRVRGTDEFVILEYKGGTAELSPGQMERPWVISRIQRMRAEGGDLGKFMADVLEQKLNQGKLSGVALSTPVSEQGVPGATTIIKQWKY